MANFVLHSTSAGLGQQAGLPIYAFGLPNIQVTAAGIRLSGPSGAALFTGNDFKLGGATGGLLDITGGTITGVTVRVGGQVGMTVTGWNLSAAQVYDSNQVQLFNLMFAKADKITGTDFGDSIDGIGGNDLIVAGGGADEVYGGVGSDRLIMGNGNDYAVGQAGNDQIRGGKGSDIIYGGVGVDHLFGGAGADQFSFSEAVLAGNRDVIGDFAHGVDHFDLYDSVFTGVDLGGLAVGAFHKGLAAQDADDRIIYDQRTGKLFFDVDGLGGAGKVQFAQVTAGLQLTAADFDILSIA